MADQNHPSRDPRRDLPSDLSSDTPSGPPRDPRLEIPEVLRTPVKKPQLPKAAGPSLSGLGDLGKALAIGIDFLATAAAGGALGWGVDWLANSSPLGLVFGLLLGFVLGTVRLISRLNKQ